MEKKTGLCLFMLIMVEGATTKTNKLIIVQLRVVNTPTDMVYKKKLG